MTYGARRSPKAPGGINQSKCLYNNAYKYVSPILTDDAEMIVLLDDFTSVGEGDVSPIYFVYNYIFLV